MTAFTRTWNAAYEAQPADTENISLGASRIRNLKEDIQERLEVDHFHAGDTQDGEHKKLTLGAPIATPANIANKGFIYGKDVGAKIELHYLDEDNNEVALTAAGSVNAFAAGTVMLFKQTSAPSGWTKGATHNDKALRVVTGSVSAAGGTPFTTVFGTPKTTGAHTLTTAEIPSHTHAWLGGGGSFMSRSGAGSSINIDTSTADTVQEQSTTEAKGGGGNHTHTLVMNLQYVDVILATKN